MGNIWRRVVTDIERYICTADAPWDKTETRTQYAMHPDAHHLRDEDHDGGDCEVFECPNCGLVFHVEMPD